MKGIRNYQITGQISKVAIFDKIIFDLSKIYLKMTRKLTVQQLVKHVKQKQKSEKEIISIYILNNCKRADLVCHTIYGM
jgi:hypothetical protein